MFQCTGKCRECGRCGVTASAREAELRKAKGLIFPTSFYPAKESGGWGVAFDIGTTTVAAMLWDLNEGKLLGSMARSNPQMVCGTDVIRRISFCLTGKDNDLFLKSQITDCCNELIAALCQEYDVSPEMITKAVVCGNTTMIHLFLGYDVRTLVTPPFEPAFTGAPDLPASDVGLEIGGEAGSDARVYVLPGIAGHVGGDITAGLLAIGGVDDSRKTDTSKQNDVSGQTDDSEKAAIPNLRLFLDIGTNGEIALIEGGSGYVCSTAAGPALEGASISQGMRAARGAVERVRADGGEIYIQTIGGGVPEGICGSGIIDAIAVMLEQGVLQEDGRLLSREEALSCGVEAELAERLTRAAGEDISERKEHNVRKFVLLAGPGEKELAITQRDIREVQLAKGALAAGILLLLQKAGKTVQDLDEIIVGGAFGNYLDQNSLIRTGILPRMPEGAIRFAGNTAGAGASMALASEEERQKANEIPGRLQHIEPADEAGFQDLFMQAMSFAEMR